MKVHELQEKLVGVDPDLEVACYLGDDAQLVAEKAAQLLDIINVGVYRGKATRKNGLALIQFNDGPDSQELVLLSLALD